MTLKEIKKLKQDKITKKNKKVLMPHQDGNKL